MRGLLGRIRTWLSGLREHVEAVALFCGLSAGALALSRSASFPSASAWDGVTMLFLSQLAVAVGLVVSQTYVFVARRRSRRSALLEDACRAVAAHIDVTAPHLQLRFVGVHIWKVAGLPFGRHLRRGARFLLAGERPQSGVRWKRGKGLVGQAWASRSPQLADLSILQRKVGCSDDWNQLSLSERLGLTWEELDATRSYKAVYAAPLFDRTPSGGDPAVRGVLAVDVMQEGHFAALQQATDDMSFASVVGICEAALTSD